jgi:hypothetical protein
MALQQSIRNALFSATMCGKKVARATKLLKGKASRCAFPIVFSKASLPVCTHLVSQEKAHHDHYAGLHAALQKIFMNAVFSCANACFSAIYPAMDRGILVLLSVILSPAIATQ